MRAHAHVQCVVARVHAKSILKACVRLVFWRAMCDRAFAHFLVTKWTENAIFLSILERPILFKNIRSCFRTSFPALERPFLFLEYPKKC